jgi:F0F1-type ATP synthase membrane subunit c/vacuolar-type H+-ATPase subunit K
LGAKVLIVENGRFIATAIMSDTVKDALTKGLTSMGSGWAEVEDSAKAVLRVASDETINGLFIHFFIFIPSIFVFSFLPSYYPSLYGRNEYRKILTASKAELLPSYQGVSEKKGSLIWIEMIIQPGVSGRTGRTLF